MILVQTECLHAVNLYVTHLSSHKPTPVPQRALVKGRFLINPKSERVKVYDFGKGLSNHFAACKINPKHVTFLWRVFSQ